MLRCCKEVDDIILNFHLRACKLIVNKNCQPYNKDKIICNLFNFKYTLNWWTNLFPLNVMNPQEGLPNFFILTEDITETIELSIFTEPESTKISQRKWCDFNYKSLFQFKLMIFQIVFQLIILVIVYRRSISFYMKRFLWKLWFMWLVLWNKRYKYIRWRIIL